MSDPKTVPVREWRAPVKPFRARLVDGRMGHAYVEDGRGTRVLRFDGWCRCRVYPTTVPRVCHPCQAAALAAAKAWAEQQNKEIDLRVRADAPAAAGWWQQPDGKHYDPPPPMPADHPGNDWACCQRTDTGRRVQNESAGRIKLYYSVYRCDRTKLDEGSLFADDYNDAAERVASRFDVRLGQALSEFATPRRPGARPSRVRVYLQVTPETTDAGRAMIKTMRAADARTRAERAALEESEQAELDSLLGSMTTAAAISRLAPGETHVPPRQDDGNTAKEEVSC